MSTFNQDDLKRLKMKIQEVLTEEWQKYELTIPSEESHIIHRLKQQSIVENEHFHEIENSYHVLGYIDPETPLYNQIIK